MKRKSLIMLLVLVFVLGSFAEIAPDSASNGMTSVDAQSIDGAIEHYTDRWAIIPKVEQGPDLDGVFDDDIWAEAVMLEDFVTAFHNEKTDTGTEVKLAYDAEHLYIGLAYAYDEEEHTLANIELLISPYSAGEAFYHVPISIKDLDLPFVNDWGPGRNAVDSHEYVVVHDEGLMTAEVAVPIAALNVDDVQNGDEWRINVINQHELNTHPLSSWMPIRTSSYSKTDTSSSVGFTIDVSAEGRMGSIFFNTLPEEWAPEPYHSIWEPREMELEYTGFMEKELSFKGVGINHVHDRIHLTWKTPSGEQIEMEDLGLERVGDRIVVPFEHPAPDENGLYQLYVHLDQQRNKSEAMFAILSFDRNSMIEAGDNLYHFSPYEGEKTQVEADPPSDTVQQILDIIPEQIGFRFTGLPDQPHLHPDRNFSWSINNPDIITSNHSDMTYPNEEYPEDQVLTVTNRNGETVEYPYYEDEDGRQYFLTAHKWWLQRNYAVGQVNRLAASDPLGAARLLYRFAEVYEGYTPVSDHIWQNYPVEPASGPAYPWWGGIWNRWSASELWDLRNLFQAYAEVKQTNAFEVLSEEVGEDVDRRIVEDMFKPSIEFARTFPIINHNMDYTKWVGLGELSKAINDSSYIHEGVELLEDYTMNEYLFDGFYKETTLSYHNQSTDGINRAMDVFQGWSDPEGYISPRSGTRFDDLDMGDQFPALGKSQEIPEILVYPDGKYFPTQDTWANESSANPNLEVDSFLLPASGIARLQRGLESGDGGGSSGEPSQLYMTFDPKYGHDHFDPLNLGLYAEGQELLPDIGYSYTFYRQWATSTMGHNTVVVDGSDMSTSGDTQHGGSIEVFAPVDDNLQVMHARQENAYSSTEEYSREPWFIGFPEGGDQGYVLDLFRVSGGDRHEYTLHGDAIRDATFETGMEVEEYGDYLLPEGTEVTMPETAYDTGDAEGHYYGYIYIQNVLQARLDNDQYELTLVTTEDGEEQAKMNITGILDSGDNELYLGESPSLRSTRVHGRDMDTNDEAVKYHMPKLVLRREGEDLTSQFITLMEPYQAEQPRIDSVEKLEMDESSEGDIAVAVTYGDTTDIILSSPHYPEEPLVVEDITLYGKMGMIRMQNDEVEDMYLIGGTQLVKGEVQLTDDGSVQGTITDVMRQADRDNYDAFVTDVQIPEEMQGNYIVVTHPDGKMHGYEISEIVREDDQTIIRTEGMDPGFSIHDDGSSGMNFYPFLQWEGEHTFRIENTVQDE